MPDFRGRGLGIAVGLGLGVVAPAMGGERAGAPAGALSPCPSQGAGFVRVPGSTTCLRLSGRLVANRGGPAVPRDAPLAMGRLSIDTRTTTEVGPVRTFVRMGAGRH